LDDLGFISFAQVSALAHKSDDDIVGMTHVGDRHSCRKSDNQDKLLASRRGRRELDRLADEIAQGLSSVFSDGLIDLKAEGDGFPFVGRCVFDEVGDIDLGSLAAGLCWN
jgi:hypothetical protein